MTDLFERDLATMLHTRTPEPLREMTGADVRGHAAHRRTRRLAVAGCVVTAAVVATLLAVVRHNSAPAPAISTTNWPRATFRGVSIAYPPGWRVHGMNETFSFATPLMYLGNQQVESPCQQHGNETACGVTPRGRLAPGGVVIYWIALGSMPGHRFKLASEPGKRTTVAGYAAKVRFGAPSVECRADRGTTAIDALILTRPTDALSMIACINGTGTTERDEVLASLHSVRITR